MKTKHPIEYERGSLPPILIPKGTPVTPARNKCGPESYWVLSWPGISREARAWEKKYGLLINKEEIEE